MSALGQNDKWEFYQDSKEEWRWRRTATNGKIVGATTEGYKNKQDCVDNAKRHGYKDANGNSTPLGQNDKWEFYQDSKEEWRWRRTATNGKIVGAASEGYKNKQDCVDNAKRQGYTEK